MPGAGSSTVAFVPESQYNTTPGTPTYYNPGTNVQIETAELDRNLLAQSLPGQVEDADALAQRFEGQLTASFVANTDDWHRIVFNDSNTGFTSGNAASAEWYLGVDLLDGSTVERHIQGWAPQSARIQYSGTTEAVRVSLQGFYAEEGRNTSITPGSITNMSTGSEVPGHGADLQFDSTTVSKLQSATIEFSNIARPHHEPGSGVTTVDAVAGDLEQSVSMTGIITNSTHLEYALGSAGASSVQDTVDSISSTLTLSDGSGSTIADYSFGSTKPRNYGWDDLVNDGADLTEPVEWWASSITASDPTA